MCVRPVHNFATSYGSLAAYVRDLPCFCLLSSSRYAIIHYERTEAGIHLNLIYPNKPCFPLDITTPRRYNISIMGTHRTAHSLLQEAMNRVSQLKVKVACSIINDNPEIIAIDSSIDSIKRDMIKVNRWLDPTNGLANSIEKWTIRIEEAKVNLAEAEASKASMLGAIQELKYERQSLAKELASDADVEADAIVSEAGIS